MVSQIRAANKFLFATAIKAKDFAIPAFPFKIQHLPALGCRLFPAGFIPVVIGRAVGMNIFRAPHKIPARLSSIPEICHCFYLEINQHGFENICATVRLMMSRPKHSLSFYILEPCSSYSRWDVREPIPRNNYF